MTTENLQRAFTELKAALDSDTPLDPELLLMLQLLDEDIQTRLAEQKSAHTTTTQSPPEKSDTAGGLTRRAQEISARFAANHPHLEPVLRELTDTLQRIGI